ncbi:YidC family membrane integrase SpoIIIJ [soil metagenome]
MGDIFTLLFVQPITNLMVGIYDLLLMLHIPSALGFSIIILTMVIRLALFPLMSQQLKSSKKMQEIAPLLAKIKEKFKGNSQRIQSETMLLYKQYGINPAAGCLPVVVQLPVIWGLYNVLQHVVKQTTLTDINKLVYSDSLKLQHVWDTYFFGLPLGQTPGQLFNYHDLATYGILILPILTAVTQFIQSKMMLPTTPPAPKDPNKKSDTASDFASAFQTQSLYIFPLMIGFFSYRFPAGLSFYWITFTIFGIIQQYLMQRGSKPLVPAPVVVEKIASPKKKKAKKR